MITTLGIKADRVCISDMYHGSGLEMDMKNHIFCTSGRSKRGLKG